jgi:hypothetical protein
LTPHQRRASSTPSVIQSCAPPDPFYNGYDPVLDHRTWAQLDALDNWYWPETWAGSNQDFIDYTERFRRPRSDPLAGTGYMLDIERYGDQQAGEFVVEDPNVWPHVVSPDVVSIDEAELEQLGDLRQLIDVDNSEPVDGLGEVQAGEQTWVEQAMDAERDETAEVDDNLSVVHGDPKEDLFE